MQREGAEPGSEKIRCPACGARNSPGAQWCGQCLTRFAPPPPPPPPAEPASAAEPPGAAETPVAWGAGFADAAIVRPPAPDATASPPAASLTADASSVEGSAASEADPPAVRVISRRGAFKATDAGVFWTCTRCGTENPLEAESCSVCGTTLAELVRPPSKERPERDPGTVTLISLFFPGAGHAYLGLWGDFAARAILQVWVVGVALLTATQGGGVIAIVFAVAAFVLWVVAAHDAYREATKDHGSALLKGRTYLWVVLGLLVVLIIGVFMAATTGRAGPGGPGLPEEI